MDYSAIATLIASGIALLTSIVTLIVNLYSQNHRELLKKRIFPTVSILNNSMDDFDTDDIRVRKLIVNTFIKEILLYEDEIIITYYFSDNQERIKFTSEHFEEVERQSRQETALAVLSPDGSYKFFSRAPKNG